MRRYLGLSLFLHLLVFAIFLYRRIEPIDDPIVAVTLDYDQKPNAPKHSIAKPKAPEEGSNKPATPVTETASVAESSADRPENANAPEAAYESGNVSVKPKVMKQIQIVYPQQAKEARIEGAVKLSVTINETGNVGDVTILDGPGFGLNEAAQEALKQFIFSPAEVAGQKVPVRIVYIYRFKLESR